LPCQSAGFTKHDSTTLKKSSKDRQCNAIVHQHPISACQICSMQFEACAAGLSQTMTVL